MAKVNVMWRQVLLIEGARDNLRALMVPGLGFRVLQNGADPFNSGVGACTPGLPGVSRGGCGLHSWMLQEYSGDSGR